MSYTYVYLLQSLYRADRHYTGLTDNLKHRLSEHNHGHVTHTTRYAPWRIVVAIAFRDRTRASEFGRHLKSHSGRAFAKRHF